LVSDPRARVRGDLHPLMTRLCRRTEARMRAIIEHAADGIVTVSDTGTIEVFNPTACKIFGYEQGDLTGENISFLFAWNYGIDF
jgi:PAS domain S-box-containing protein